MIISFIGSIIIFYYFIRLIRRWTCRPNFKDKIIWITGASSGLGQYLAYQVIKYNARKVIISARNLTQLQRVKNSCKNPQKIQIVKLDMTDYDSIKRQTDKVIENLLKENLKLDIVIQNAGVAQKADFMNFSFEDHIKLTQTNVHGPYFHIKCFLDHMIKNKSGHIVAINSIMGRFSNANRCSYAPSKHALTSIFDSLRSELWQHNIKVSTIYPGVIQSNVGKNALGKRMVQGSDKDIKYDSGMSTEVFANEAVRSIYMQEYECIVATQSIRNPLRYLVRGICPDLSFFWTYEWFNKSLVKTNVQIYYQNKFRMKQK